MGSTSNSMVITARNISQRGARGNWSSTRCHQFFALALVGTLVVNGLAIGMVVYRAQHQTGRALPPVLEITFTAAPVPDVPAPTLPAPIVPPTKAAKPDTTPAPLTKAKPKTVAVAPVAQPHEAELVAAAEPQPVESAVAPIVEPAPAPVPVVAVAPVVAAPVETPPSFDAAYLNNPEPEYPRAAKRLGIQGMVLLRVMVSAQGKPQSIDIAVSSGSPLLDDAAVTAVRGWTFIPARRGDDTIAAPVQVPLRFTLNRG